MPILGTGEHISANAPQYDHRMRKPEPTKRQTMRFITTPRLRVRMEFTLDFDRPISVLKAREAARKILDHLEVNVNGYEPPEELGEVSLRCSELKRVVKIQVD